MTRKTKVPLMTLDQAFAMTDAAIKARRTVNPEWAYIAGRLNAVIALALSSTDSQTTLLESLRDMHIGTGA